MEFLLRVRALVFLSLALLVSSAHFRSKPSTQAVEHGALHTAQLHLAHATQEEVQQCHLKNGTHLSKKQQPAPADSWEDGATFEKQFWEQWAASPETQYRMDVNTPFHFQQQVILPRDPGQMAFQVLDVGAGPMPALGYKITDLPGATMNLTAVDPLGDQYKQMLAKRGIQSPVPVIQMMAEDLSTHFAPNSFDLAYSRNALDHAKDPMAAIAAMVNLVKPNHHVMVITFVNEGAHCNGVGFHQWNFCNVNGRFVLWSNKEKVPRDIGAELGPLVQAVGCDTYSQATFNELTHAGQGLMTCWITKSR